MFLPSATKYDPLKGNIMVRYPETKNFIDSRKNEKELLASSGVLKLEEAQARVNGVYWHIEEWIDGAHVAISVNDRGDLVVQNRSQVLHHKPGKHSDVYPFLWPWVERNRETLERALWPHMVLYGDWVVSTRTVHYDYMTDLFICHTVLDRDAGLFLSPSARNDLLAVLGYERPLDGQLKKIFTFDELIELAREPSAFSEKSGGFPKAARKGIILTSTDSGDEFIDERYCIQNPDLEHRNDVARPLKFNKFYGHEIEEAGIV
jgi:hypothetical protein